MAQQQVPRRRGRQPAVRADLNVAGLMRRVNAIREASGRPAVPRNRWPSDRRDLQPYIEEVRAAAPAS